MKLTKKEQKQLFIEIADNIKESGEYYAKMLLLENTDEMYKKIINMEDEGDEFQARLDAHFSTQKNAPYLTLERAKLLRRMDDVLDNFAIAARTLSVFAEGLPQDFVQNAGEISRLVCEVTEDFSKGMNNLYTNFHESLRNSSRIEQSRDRLVEEIFRLETLYFKNLKGNDAWRQFTAIERVMKRTIAVIQKIRDAGEIIEIMVYKYSAE